MNPWSYGVGLNQGFSVVMLGNFGGKNRSIGPRHRLTFQGGQDKVGRWGLIGLKRCGYGIYRRQEISMSLVGAPRTPGCQPQIWRFIWDSLLSECNNAGKVTGILSGGLDPKYIHMAPENQILNRATTPVFLGIFGRTPYQLKMGLLTPI